MSEPTSLERQVADLLTTIKLDRKDREHADRELGTKLDTLLDMMSSLKSDQAAIAKQINGLPDTVPSMRQLARAVEANTTAITTMRSIAEDAHSKASRNDKILTGAILAGISSFVALVFALAQSGVF